MRNNIAHIGIQTSDIIATLNPIQKLHKKDMQILEFS